MNNDSVSKMCDMMEQLGYMARLQKANLYTLELRRMWADLCFYYKILRGHVDTPIEKFLSSINLGKLEGIIGN